jgi:hypothetical protein
MELGKNGINLLTCIRNCFNVTEVLNPTCNLPRRKQDRFVNGIALRSLFYLSYQRGKLEVLQKPLK